MRKAGIPVATEISRATRAQIETEAERLIKLRSRTFSVYVSGPNADDTGVNVQLAPGSFAAAADRGTNVFAELAVRVPAVVTEGGQPIPAFLRQ